MVGMPIPNPTAKAILSPVSRPESEPEPVLALVLVPSLLLLPPLLVLFFRVLVSVGAEPAVDVELGFELPLPLPLLSVDPVATAASADTTAVVVLLGCGLFAAG